MGQGDVLITAKPVNAAPPTVWEVVPGDPEQYLQDNRMTYIQELERTAKQTEDERVRASILRILLNFSSLGQKKTQFNQSNIRQEVHLHGAQSLPDFNHLPTKKLRELLGQVEDAMNPGEKEDSC